jgi:hypothetical protein
MNDMNELRQALKAYDVEKVKQIVNSEIIDVTDEDKGIVDFLKDICKL